MSDFPGRSERRRSARPDLALSLAILGLFLPICAGG
jgi:hypothetical protein